jgi:WD repeat-containing protein 42A
MFDANGPWDSPGLCLTHKQKYTGRRNVQTFLKEVAFFGEDSYVATGTQLSNISFVCIIKISCTNGITGSDCGHLFIWEKTTGKLVQLLKADKGVVNGVSPHPTLPILATCGLDSTTKIFECGDKSTFVPSHAEVITVEMW